MRCFQTAPASLGRAVPSPGASACSLPTHQALVPPGNHAPMPKGTSPSAKRLCPAAVSCWATKPTKKPCSLPREQALGAPGTRAVLPPGLGAFHQVPSTLRLLHLLLFPKGTHFLLPTLVFVCGCRERRQDSRAAEQTPALLQGIAAVAEPSFPGLAPARGSIGSCCVTVWSCICCSRG